MIIQLSVRFQTMGSISEAKLNPELNLAWGLRRSKGTKALVSYVGIKAHEVGVIENVEELGAELDAVAFTYPPVLCH